MCAPRVSGAHETILNAIVDGGIVYGVYVIIIIQEITHTIWAARTKDEREWFVVDLDRVRRNIEEVHETMFNACIACD